MGINRGDTAIVMLKDILVNGSAMQQDAYDEILVQFNYDSFDNSITKQLSKGEVLWGTIQYTEEGVQKTFTGYYCVLTEKNTLKLGNNMNIQVRVSIGDDVGSTSISNDYNVGSSLSEKEIAQ